MHGRPLALGIAALALAATARADAPAAPGLSTLAAHKITSEALRAVVAKLPDADQQKIVGVYVAFHADPKAPLALAACDDDGDYVVVVSDALLGLADAVARAEATDDAFGTKKLDEYAALLAKAQRPGERLLTPPAGFYEPSHATPEVLAAQAKRFRAIATYLVATEAAHMTAGDLVCPRPTATHERGDDEWTASEQAAALSAARAVHDPRRVFTADAHGAALATRAGEAEDAYAGLLTPVFAAMEASETARASAPYLAHHPSSGVRALIVKTAARREKEPKSP